LLLLATLLRQIYDEVQILPYSGPKLTEVLALSATSELSYLTKLTALHEKLGLAASLLKDAKLGLCKQPLCAEAQSLVSVGDDVFGRPQRLAPAAAQAWMQIQKEASKQGITLQLVSAYRSIDYQAEIIARKLSAGEALSDILKVSAAPGFSEHHTGNAVDVTTEGVEALDEAFDETECFRWLLAYAGKFGFVLTYPRDNPFGIAYEPWHWCYRPGSV